MLELTSHPDGSAHGTLDGIPVELGRNGRLCIPVQGVWPGAVGTVPAPGKRALGAKALRNRAARPLWLGEAFAQPEVRACVLALADHPLRIDVSEQVLLVRWTREVDGPSIRRAAHGLAALARALPKAMEEVVAARVAADELARRQASLARPALPLPKPITEAELQDKLRARLDWFEGSALFAILGGVLLLAVFAFAPARLALVLGVSWFALAWSAAVLRCPRCRKRLLSWNRAQRGRRRRTCRHCGLRALDPGAANENGGADEEPAPPRSKAS